MTAVTARTFAPPIPQELQAPPLLNLSFLCFCLFNLAYYSRFFEWKLTSLHVPLIASFIALLGAAMEGRLLAIFGTKIGKCMAILTLLYTINVPFSSWRGGSFGVLKDDWLKTVIAFAIAAALIFDFKQCRIAFHSIGWGSGIAGLMVNSMGQMVNGRLTLGSGSLGNSNEIAFDLLLGLPFLWLMLKDPRASKPKKLVLIFLMMNNAAGLLRTASRAGLIAFVVLNLLFFLRLSIGGKIVTACSALLLVAAGLAAIADRRESPLRDALFGSGCRIRCSGRSKPAAGCEFGRRFGRGPAPVADQQSEAHHNSPAPRRGNRPIRALYGESRRHHRAPGQMAGHS